MSLMFAMNTLCLTDTPHDMTRISISGALGSGKTTLVRAISRRIGNACYTPDLPRDVISLLGEDICHADSLAFQHFIGFQQLRVEQLVPRSVDLAIHDKSLLDALAYWRVLVGGQDPIWSKSINETRYDLVLLCDFRDIISAEADPIRLPHIHLQKAIDCELRRIINQHSMKHITLTGGARKRSNDAIKAIQRLHA